MRMTAVNIAVSLRKTYISHQKCDVHGSGLIASRVGRRQRMDPRTSLFLTEMKLGLLRNCDQVRVLC